jgi:Putative DNA-binding domain
MPTIQKNELEEFVESPTETLSVEYKSWLDLGDPETRADLARHIAALANYGGGVVVFGFTDEMYFAGQNPFPNRACTRDTVAGIVRKYLEPSFQCDVQMIRSAAGNEHPIIIVPPHGAAPVCARAGGPEIKGRVRGIVKGCYYIRKPGPSSEPIQSGAEWVPLIRRCVMHERSAILGAIGAALREPEKVPSISEGLKTWHDAGRAPFDGRFREGLISNEFGNAQFQFSYAIEHGEGQRIEINRLMDILRQVNSEVRGVITESCGSGAGMKEAAYPSA